MENQEKKEKKVRRKKSLSSFVETQDKLMEKLKKMEEEKKKYIFSMLEKIFNEILNNNELLEVLDEYKDDKEFQEQLSSILKREILNKK